MWWWWWWCWSHKRHTWICSLWCFFRPVNNWKKNWRWKLIFHLKHFESIGFVVLFWYFLHLWTVQEEFAFICVLFTLSTHITYFKISIELLEFGNVDGCAFINSSAYSVARFPQTIVQANTNPFDFSPACGEVKRRQIENQLCLIIIWKHGFRIINETNCSNDHCIYLIYFVHTHCNCSASVIFIFINGTLLLYCGWKKEEKSQCSMLQTWAGARKWKCWWIYGWMLIFLYGQAIA